MAERSHGSADEGTEPSSAMPRAWSALHASVGAVLVGEDGCLVDANPTALGLLGLGPADVGKRIDVRLAQISVCHQFGPNNGVVAHCSQTGDDRVGAHCLPMGVAGSATTLYLLWDKDAVAHLLNPHGRGQP